MHVLDALYILLSIYSNHLFTDVKTSERDWQRLYAKLAAEQEFSSLYNDLLRDLPLPSGTGSYQSSSIKNLVSLSQLREFSDDKGRLVEDEPQSLDDVKEMVAEVGIEGGFKIQSGLDEEKILAALVCGKNGQYVPGMKDMATGEVRRRVSTTCFALRRDSIGSAGLPTEQIIWVPWEHRNKEVIQEKKRGEVDEIEKGLASTTTRQLVIRLKSSRNL